MRILRLENQSAEIDSGRQSQARRRCWGWQLTPEIRFQVVANGDRERSGKGEQTKAGLRRY